MKMYMCAGEARCGKQPRSRPNRACNKCASRYIFYNTAARERELIAALSACDTRRDDYENAATSTCQLFLFLLTSLCAACGFFAEPSCSVACRNITKSALSASNFLFVDKRIFYA